MRPAGGPTPDPDLVMIAFTPTPPSRPSSAPRRAPGMVAAVLLGVVAFTGCADESAPPPPVACTLELVDRIDADRAMDHLRHLSVEIGPRVASSVAEREAAEYLAAELRSMGYADVVIQEFPREGVVGYVDVLSPTGVRVNVAAGRVPQTPAAETPILT
jgi:hypothetical protein